MKAKKTLSIISFSITLATLLFIFIVDLMVFHKAILTVLAGALISALAFVFLFVMMLFSFVLIFGIYAIKEYGFWPLNISVELFKEILQDVEITSSQMNTFRIFRIIFLVLLIASFIIAIISMCKNKRTKEVNPYKWMSVIALIVSILGIIVGMGILAVTPAIG